MKTTIEITVETNDKAKMKYFMPNDPDREYYLPEDKKKENDMTQEMCADVHRTVRGFDWEEAVTDLLLERILESSELPEDFDDIDLRTNLGYKIKFRVTPRK